MPERNQALNKRFIIKVLCRPVALTVERRTPNPGVGGSNPSWPAKSFLIKNSKLESHGSMTSCTLNFVMLGAPWHGYIGKKL